MNVTLHLRELIGAIVVFGSLVGSWYITIDKVNRVSEDLRELKAEVYALRGNVQYLLGYGIVEGWKLPKDGPWVEPMPER